MIEQLTSSIWWRGAAAASLKSIPLGIAVGLGAAAFMAFVAIPLMPGFAGLMGAFLSFPGVSSALLPTIPVVGTPFFPIGLILFNTAIGAVSSALTGGNAAIKQHETLQWQRTTENKLMELDGRTQTLEQTVSPSRATQKILAQGPRNAGNFRDAEDARAAAASSTPTIH